MIGDVFLADGHGRQTAIPDESRSCRIDSRNPAIWFQLGQRLLAAHLAQYLLGDESVCLDVPVCIVRAENHVTLNIRQQRCNDFRRHREVPDAVITAEVLQRLPIGLGKTGHQNAHAMA